MLIIKQTSKFSYHDPAAYIENKRIYLFSALTGTDGFEYRLTMRMANSHCVLCKKRSNGLFFYSNHHGFSYLSISKRKMHPLHFVAGAFFGRGSRIRPSARHLPRVLNARRPNFSRNSVPADRFWLKMIYYIIFLTPKPSRVLILYTIRKIKTDT